MSIPGNIIMWGICGVCTLALTVAKTSSHYDRFAIFVTSTSQHQIFDEKFDQGPESVRIKMADLAGR